VIKRTIESDIITQNKLLNISHFQFPHLQYVFVRKYLKASMFLFQFWSAPSSASAAGASGGSSGNEGQRMERRQRKMKR